MTAKQNKANKSRNRQNEAKANVVTNDTTQAASENKAGKDNNRQSNVAAFPKGHNAKPVKHTLQNAKDLQSAYDFFNRKLFKNQLPQPIITWRAAKSLNGFYHYQKWTDGAGFPVDEIALNPEIANKRDERATLSTLVHEMCHLWQFHFGEPSRENGSYHNREWAEKMKTLGLMPQGGATKNGETKETGQKVSHTIADAGKYAKAYEAYKAAGNALNYSAIPEPPKESKNKTQKSKYTSPDGNVEFTAKAGLEIYTKLGEKFVETPKGSNAGNKGNGESETKQAA